MLHTTDTVKRYDGPFTLDQVINYNIPYINDSDLIITVDGVVLAYNGDYGVTAIKSEGLVTGATITLYRDMPGETMVIRRKTPLTQEQDYPENGPFESTDVERSLDKLTMLAQENSYENQRFIKINNAEIASYNNELPPATDKPQMIVLTNKEIYLEEADPGAIRASQAMAEEAANRATEEANKAGTFADAAEENAQRAEDAMERAEVAAIPLGQEDGDVLSWNGERVAPEWKAIPIATEEKEGVSKPDGYTVNIQNGTLYANLDGSLKTATALKPLYHDMSEFNSSIVDIGGFAVLSPEVFAVCPSNFSYLVTPSGTAAHQISFIGPQDWFTTANQVNGKPPKLKKAILAGTWYKPELGDTIKCMEYYNTTTGEKYKHGFSCCMGNMDADGHFTPVLSFNNTTNWTNKNLYYIKDTELPEFTYPDPTGAGATSSFTFYFRSGEWGKPTEDVCTMYREDETTVPYFTLTSTLKPVSDLWEDGNMAVLGVHYLGSDGEKRAAYFDKCGPTILQDINYIIFETPIAEVYDTPPANAMKWGTMGIYAAGGYPKWEPGKTTYANSLGMRYDSETLGVNEAGALYAKIPPAATTETLGTVKPDGTTITISEDGTITSVGGGGGGGAGGSDLYGIRGDYATHYGILDCPNGLVHYTTENRTITTYPSITVQCAGADYKSVLASTLTYTIQSVTDVVLFYAEGELLEAGDVFYQEDEPQNGTSSYAAWYSPNVKKWQFKSNDTGNVWREAIATPLANIGITEGVITRVDYIGYRILDDDILAHKSDIPEGTFDTAISPLTVNRVEDVPANLSTYSDGAFAFLNNLAYSTTNSTNTFTQTSNGLAINIYGVGDTDTTTGLRPLKDNAHMKFYYSPAYGDKIYITKYYRSGDLENWYTSQRPSVLFGQLDANNMFYPKLILLVSSATFTMQVYYGDAIVSYPATGAIRYTFTNGTSCTSFSYSFSQSSKPINYYEFTESINGTLAVKINLAEDGTEEKIIDTGFPLAELGINAGIIDMKAIDSTEPASTTNMLKIAETYIERDGVKIWAPGTVTKGSHLQLLYDSTTVSVVNGRLTAAPIKAQTEANTTALGGLSFRKLTEAEYTALTTKNASTLYAVTSADGTMFELYLGTLALTLT